MTGRGFSIDIQAISAHTTYEAPDDSDLTGMLKENLIAERIVISAYQEIIGWLGDGDITTRRMLESILAEEEEHADDMLDLLGTLRG
jgi:bacterioferritin